MISTKGRYALRVMLDLAEHDNGNYIPLKDIAERQEISKKYLEIIMKDMVAGGLVFGASGKGGGYRLCKKPEKYIIGEILELMEGPMASVACLSDKSFKCNRKKSCHTLPLWVEYDKMVHDFFYTKHLSDLLEPEDDCPEEDTKVAPKSSAKSEDKAKTVKSKATSASTSEVKKSKS